MLRIVLWKSRNLKKEKVGGEMENKEKKGGFFEQIQGNINPVVLEYYYGPKMKESDTSFPYLVRVSLR